jgi:hypothetical protein
MVRFAKVMFVNSYVIVSLSLSPLMVRFAKVMFFKFLCVIVPLSLSPLMVRFAKVMFVNSYV